MICFELLMITRTTLFQAIEFYDHLQPFFNSSPFVLGLIQIWKKIFFNFFYKDGFFMTIFLCVLYTWNKEYFRGNEMLCASSVSIFTTLIVLINLVSIAISIVIYNVKVTKNLSY